MEALAVTARLCGPELERYGRCVAASPGSWHRDCHQLSLSVTECASNHPLVRRIRRDCSDSFGAFERCLRERPRSAAECGPHVNRFLLCAQSVTHGDTHGGTQGGTPSVTQSTQSGTQGGTHRDTHSGTQGGTPSVTQSGTQSVTPSATPGVTPGDTPTENPWN